MPRYVSMNVCMTERKVSRLHSCSLIPPPFLQPAVLISVRFIEVCVSAETTFRSMKFTAVFAFYIFLCLCHSLFIVFFLSSPVKLFHSCSLCCMLFYFHFYFLFLWVVINFLFTKTSLMHKLLKIADIH